MDNVIDEKQESIIDKIEKVKGEFPDLVIPTMGIVDIENNIDIDAKDYFN